MALNTYPDDSVLKSSDVNEDFLGISNGSEMHYNAAWTSYTPTWTATTSNPAIGNGTLTGRYLLMGKTVYVRIYLQYGSTSTAGSGNWKWALPFNNATNITKHLVVGTSAILDSGTAYYRGWVVISSDYQNRVGIILGRTDTTYIQQDYAVTNTAPMTPANGDFYSLTFCYERA